MTRSAATGFAWALLFVVASAHAHAPDGDAAPSAREGLGMAATGARDGNATAIEARDGRAARDRPLRRWRGRHDSLLDIPVPEGVRVPAWADLSPERQQRLARMKEDWDTLPASRRVHALERLERRRRWEALAPEERERLRQGARNFRDLPPELKDRMRESMRAMRALPDDERRKLFERWRALDPDARREWLQAGGPGLAPAPGDD